MRPITLLNATKVLIVVFAMILSFTDFAEARDRDGDHNHVRRPHFERSHHERREVLSGTNVDSRLHRRDRHIRLSGRNADRRHFERRYGFDRGPDRRMVVREYRRDRPNGWAPSYGGDDFPSDTTGGTYFGGLSAWTDPGNGTYFSSDRGGYGYYTGDINVNYYSPARPKIIRVTPSTAGRACSWESGVCVIRR
jgi:hypothetical protein